MNISEMLQEIQAKRSLTIAALAEVLGASFVSVNRWIQGTAKPSPAQIRQIQQIYESVSIYSREKITPIANHFSSRGLSRNLPLFDLLLPKVTLSDTTFGSILPRIKQDIFFMSEDHVTLNDILSTHKTPALTADDPPESGMSAGKNTYTYDAHTYHTKVPPQGIAELLSHYLPSGGLVLDPFAGSGMTGVAARTLGIDCILNELSPAASFIARQFSSMINPDLFQAGVNAIIEATREIREQLYTTQCRECGRNTEILYTVWSYNVSCPHCHTEFTLWDHCRHYGRIVREHKILSEFPCPQCKRTLKKSTLERTKPRPVLLGYKCCGSKQQEVTHPLAEEDLIHIHNIEVSPPLIEAYIPRTKLPDGVNLRQPKKHGIDTVDKFYTTRNLAAMSHLWYTIHRVEQAELAAFLAFAFTSLYQRVTRLSEFRFWGGSGNTARFNVPYIFNETNVFVTFIRKTNSILDHLRTTAQSYTGHTIIANNSATSLNFLPDNSIDLIFTDPPFGANINYSEMNILWESWLGDFTDTTNEAIINKFQGKGIDEYELLMRASLQECYRVLRPGRWLLLVFMNSSKEVWEALRSAITQAGFEIVKADLFDKHHGTFKHFVSENTTGFDLVLHCRKPMIKVNVAQERRKAQLHESVISFLHTKGAKLPTNSFLHVERNREIDYRQLYSEWLAQSLLETPEFLNFSSFRTIIMNHIDHNSIVNPANIFPTANGNIEKEGGYPLQRPRTLPVFTPEQRRLAHELLAAKVAFMMGRKFEEGDWADVYCRAKNIPNTGWSNLHLDVIYKGLGIEHKMLCYRSRSEISEASGNRFMHPSATRSFRMPPSTTDPNEAMRDILTQYADFIEARRAKVRETIEGDGEPDLRVGWLLWQESLRQFLYFEEEMLPPNPDDYTAEWVKRESKGARKSSTNLWIFERETGYKRYSVTSEAGAKIQPYFDVPPLTDPNLYIFTVIGEYIDFDLVRVWVTDATARDLTLLLGKLDTENVSRAILESTGKIAESEPVEYSIREVAHPITITSKAYGALKSALPGVNDEHSFQLLAQYLRSKK